MQTNIHLAQLLAEDRQRELREYAEGRRRLLASLPAREHRGTWISRLFGRDADSSVTGATCVQA